MKPFLFILLFYTVVVGNAQSWCTPGSTWYYDYGGGAASAYAKLSCIRDTVMNGITYNEISIQKEGIRGSSGYFFHFNNYSNLYIHTTNNVVYINNDTLFSFNFAPGTKWRLPRTGNYRCPSIVTVIDTGNTTFQGQNLKYLLVDISKSGYHMIDSVIDKIGFLSTYAFDFDSWCYNDCAPEFGGALRCFYNGRLNYINHAIHSCDYFFSTGISKTYNERPFVVFPNPVSGEIFLKNIASTQKLEVCIKDITGAILKRTNFLDSPDTVKTIDIRDITDGIYFICVSDDLHSYTPQKIIVRNVD